MAREPVTVVEIDIDYCTRTFGTSPCTATLGGSVVRKCYNTWNTCRLKSAYNKGTKTLTFAQSVDRMPVSGNYIPCLVDASGRSGTVNIAGADERLSALGKRAVVSVKMLDFPYNDILTDKYQFERQTGDAQIDEGGYNPLDRMSFWTKLKARSPNYSGRPLRIIQGWIDGGVFVAEKTRHYIMTEIDGPDSRGNVTIEAKDILALADDDKAVAPKASRGFLSADIDAVATSITLLPAGVGAEYDASGWATIGSEIVLFTRSGDVLTLMRGRRGTVAANHSVNDTVQQTFSVRLNRVDSVIRDLLVIFAGVPSGFIPFTDWQDEVDRWGGNLRLTADICKPEGVSTLIGELAVLGITLWWDDVAQQIKLRINRPPDTDTVFDISDRNNIISISQEDRDADRLTRVSFWTVQIDPTKGLDKSNFLRQQLTVDVDAESPSNYNGQRIKEVYSRWVNQGADSLVRVLSKRLLNRFNKQPVNYEMTLDIKDDIELAQVIRLSSMVSADESGKPSNSLMQVISRDDIRSGHSLKVVAQKFQFDGRYGYITENSRPVYASSSAAQKARGAYFVDETTLLFPSDNTQPYVFI